MSHILTRNLLLLRHYLASSWIYDVSDLCMLAKKSNEEEIIYVRCTNYKAVIYHMMEKI